MKETKVTVDGHTYCAVAFGSVFLINLTDTEQVMPGKLVLPRSGHVAQSATTPLGDIAVNVPNERCDFMYLVPDSVKKVLYHRMDILTADDWTVVVALLLATVNTE